MNSKKKFSLFISFIIISVLISIFSGFFGFNKTAIETFISANHNLAAITYNLLFITLAAFSFSISIMTSVGTLFFSRYEVMSYAMIGIMGSSIIHFYISRKLGKDYVRNYLEKKGGKIEKFDQIIEKDKFKSIIILSATVFVPPTIPNFLGGVMKISLKKYFVATFLGNLPNTIFTVLFIEGLLYSNYTLVYSSVAGVAMVTLIALYFYKGEIKSILRLSLPSFFKN